VNGNGKKLALENQRKEGGRGGEEEDNKNGDGFLAEVGSPSEGNKGFVS